MKPEPVQIQPTGHTPGIDLNPGGIVKITGRAINESGSKFSDELMKWIDSYMSDPAESTSVLIALEYLNSYNSIYISSVLKKLSQLKVKKKKLEINWYVEKDDDDLLERGEYISSVTGVPINFRITEQIRNFID